MNNVRRGILSQSLVDKSKYLTVECPKDYSGQIVITSIGSTANFAKLEFSKNGADWSPVQGAITLNSGEYASFKGSLTPTTLTGVGVSQISGGPFNLSGNCFSILFGDLYDYVVNNTLSSTINNYAYAFYRLFYNTPVRDVSEDFLPLPLVSNNMYTQMFAQCTRLTSAPKLPALTLKLQCYYSMFNGCTSLTTAPELPATTLPIGCYNTMFANCSKLNYIKAMFLTTPSTTYTSNWLNGVASSGTFIKNKDATWNVSGTSGIPTGWTVITE